MFQKLALYFHTLKYLKWVQIRYQIYYRLRKKWRKITSFTYNYKNKLPSFLLVSMAESIENYNTYLGLFNFTILNLDHTFDKEVDWDLAEYGKLWTYNLNYFEYLNQVDQSSFNSEYDLLLNNFIEKLPYLNNANEPFPTSLRIINWIKYFTRNNITNDFWNTSLYSQSYILLDNVEYHLLGNHLLENGFALTMAGIYFQDKALYQKGENILKVELEEQILVDGAHFELSPMYHCLMLYRVLDTINMCKSNQDIANDLSPDSFDFLQLLISKASMMCGWLQAMTFDDGSYPHFNDSTNGIAPNVSQLLRYAERLDVLTEASKLQDSGYRRLKNENFDLFFKVGNIGPDYIPGHAHADSLSVISKIGGQDLFVDIGISTYEKNMKRKEERSTEYHNTINVAGKDSSQVWGGFRVGKRAYTRIVLDSENEIVAYHNAYGQPHVRTVKMLGKSLIIEDKTNLSNCQAHFHFHPDVTVSYFESSIILDNETNIIFSNASKIEILSYSYCVAFNKNRPASKVKVGFDNSLITQISKN